MRFLRAIALASILAAPLAAKEIPLNLSNPNNVTIPWPVTLGVPLPWGELKDAAGVTLVDPKGAPVPAQFTVQSRWWARDKSVQVLQTSFIADPAVNQYRLVYGGPAAPAPAAALAQRQGGRITVNTGALRCVLDAKRFRLFEEISFDANGDGKFDPEEIVAVPGGLHVEDFATEAAPPEKVEIEEAGPVRAVIAFHGRFAQPGGKTKLQYILRLYFAAGSPTVLMDYTFIQNDGQPFVDAASISLDVGLPAGARRAVFGLPDGKEAPFDLKSADTLAFTQLGPEQPVSIYKKGFNADDTAWLNKVLDERKKWRSPEEDGLWERDERHKTWNADWTINGQKARSEQKAAHWLRVEPQGKPWALAAGVRWMWQLHPEGFALAPDKLRLFAYPPLPKPLHLQVGMAKTHTFFLSFHKSGAPAAGLQAAAAVDAPPLYFPTAQWMCDSKVWGALWPRQSGKFRLFEERTQNILDRYWDPAASGGDVLFGMMNFGDRLYSNGQWLNMETAIDYGLFIEFIRTGERKYFDQFERCINHFRDVDTSHGGLNQGQWDYGQWIMPGYVPERLAAECAKDAKLRDATFYYLGDQPPRAGGVRRHSYYHSQNAGFYPALPTTKAPEKRGKCYGGTVNISGHGWIIGTIAHYMFTGDRYSLETALLSGDYITALQPHPQWGRDNWKYIDLVHLYRATGREEYRKRVLDSVQYFFDHRNEVVPKVAGQTEALMSPWYTITHFIRDYHQLSGDPAVAEKLVPMVRLWLDEVEKTCVDSGQGKVFGYIRDFKDSRCHGDFADLAYCYYLTGDRSYIDRGLSSFKLYMRHCDHSTSFYEIPFVLTQLAKLGLDPLDEPRPASSIATGARYFVKQPGKPLAVHLNQSGGYRVSAKAIEGSARLLAPDGKPAAEYKITMGGLDAFTLSAPAQAPAGAYKLETQVPSGIYFYISSDTPPLDKPPQ